MSGLRAKLDPTVPSKQSVIDVPCSELIRRLKQVQPRLTVIAVGRHGCDGADHSVESFQPETLLHLLERLHADKAAQIRQRQQTLSDQP